MGQSLTHTFSTVSESDTQKVVRLRIYYNSTEGVSDSSNDFDVTGDFPNKSNQSLSISIPFGGGQQLIYDENLTITKQYGTQVSKDFSASLSGINYWGGTITKSGSVSASARPYNTPSAPTAVSVSRTNDNKHVVSWTRNASSSAPYTSQNVQRRTFNNGAWGSWSTVGTIGTDYTGSGSNSYTDNNTVADRAYQYRVQAVNSSGSATTASTGTSYTSPATPASVVATKSGTDIKVTITPGQEVSAVDFKVQESTNGGTSWVDLPGGTINGGNSGTYTYTHVSPSTAVTHRYRAQAIIDSSGAESGNGLSSGWKESATVQLAAPPSAPTNLAPNGQPKQATEAIPLTWLHNPTDSSEQRKFQVRHRTTGGAWTEASVVTSVNETWTLPANTYANGVTVEWAVRTWGVATTGGSDGTGASNYSATATITMSTPPTASINAPADAEVLATSVLELDWGFFDPEDANQTAWEIELLDSEGETLEAKSGVGTDHIVAFNTAAEDDGAYTMRVRVQDSTGFWSDWDQVNVTVSFLPPALVGMDATYYPESGSVALTLQPQAAEPGVTEEATTVTVQRSIDGGPWITVFESVPADSALVDTSPTIHGVNCYRVIVYSDLPSSRVQETADVATNMFANPAFNDASGATVEVRRNRIPNPALTNNTTGWSFTVTGGAATITSETAPAEEAFSKYLKAAITAAPTSSVTLAFCLPNAGGVPVTAGQSYAGSAWFYSTKDISTEIIIVWYDGGGAYLSQSGITPVTLTANEWTRLAVVATAPAGAVYARLRNNHANASSVLVPGDWIGGGGPLLEQASAVYPYFDGAYSPDTDLAPEWVGTAGASESRLLGDVPAFTVIGNGRVSYLSSRWSAQGGGQSVLIRSTSTDPLGVRLLGMGGSPGSTLVPPGIYTLKAVMRVDVDDASLGSRSYRPLLWSDGLGAVVDFPDTLWGGKAGEFVYDWTFEIPDDGANYGLYLGAARPVGGEVWWDDVLVVSGEYDGPNFNPTLGVEETSVSCKGVPPEAPLTVVENADGTSTLQTCFVAVVTDDDSNGFLNIGNGFEEVAVLVCDMQFSTVTGRKKELHHFAGRERPLEFSSSSTNHTLTVNGTVTGIFTSVEEVEEFARTSGIVLWRDYTGRRLFGSLGDVSASMKDQTTPDVWDISFPVTEVDYAG